jgi:hypothetical protein
VGAFEIDGMSIGGPAPRRHTSALVLWVVMALAATPVAAQVRDTTRAGADTLASDTLVAARDTTPPPVLVPIPTVRRAVGFGAGIAVWDRNALLLEPAVTLLDLLARVPGVSVFRSGVFLQPEAATLYGGGGGRTIVELDGYVLDPLLASSLDLSTIELIHLDEVRIERRPDALVVRLRSDAARDYRPYSRIEAGIGEPKANQFRGILLAPHFLIGPVGVGVERLELEGAGRPQPADIFSGWARWGWLSPARGIELELRSNRLRRNNGSPIPLELDRNDVVLRLRNRFADGLAGEAYAGRSSVKANDLLVGIDDSLRYRVDRSWMQVGGRASADFSGGSGEIAVRWREDPAMPRLEFDASLEGRAGEWFSLTVGATHQSWRGGASATSWRASAQSGRVGPFRAFGEYGGGKRGALRLPDLNQWDIAERIMVRGGVEGAIGGLQAGGAWVKVEADSILTFGLPSDSAQSVLPAGEVTGWEAWGRVPLFRDWLYAYGSYSIFTGGTRWTYLPASQLHGTLELHSLPLASGNLELLGRLDAFRRGPMLGPPAGASLPGEELPTRTLLNASFQIRIIDVRIYVRFDDMLGQEVEDVPGLVIQGPRIFYGVKWNFQN